VSGAEPQTILLTGATGKVGRTLLKYLLEEGYRVIALALRSAGLAELYREHRAHLESSMLAAMAVDLLQEGSIMEVKSFLDERGLQPESLINNARSQEFLQVGKDGITGQREFIREFQLGVVVPYELVMALVVEERARLRSVINIGSIYGIVSPNLALYQAPERESPINYGVVKSALLHLTKELAVRLASRGVRVNAVSFGGIEGRVDEAFKMRYAALCPLGRMLRDEEVIGPVEFLMSERSSGMTGHNLVVDGGWTAW
jgi:NAD(P)-dependent dehydrogenase (short-subunit alcohol dehydrogenase family)